MGGWMSCACRRSDACGKWATKRLAGLLTPCTGFATSSGAQALKRVARSLHPCLGQHVGSVRRLLPGLGPERGSVVTPASLMREALRARVQAGGHVPE